MRSLLHKSLFESEVSSIRAERKVAGAEGMRSQESLCLGSVEQKLNEVLVNTLMLQTLPHLPETSTS